MRKLFGILVWSVGYFYCSKIAIAKLWMGVNVFSIRLWRGLFSTWRSGEWLVDTPTEYALCTVLALWIPVWLIGIFIIARLFRRKDSSTSKVVQQAAVASHPFIPAYTPANMPSQGKSAVLPETLPTPTSTNMSVEQSEDQTDWVPKDTGEAHALDVITQIAEENGLTPFPHVLLESELIPITISSDIDALLLKVLAVQGSWQVGMTEPLEQSMWSCNGQSKNVLKEIVLGKGILSKMEPESKVIPVVVLAQGDLENQEVVLPWLLQKGVEVVTLPDNSRPGIPQLTDILVKYFGQSKEKEGSNEMESSATVQETSN